jgi:hypothetical protein
VHQPYGFLCALNHCVSIIQSSNNLETLEFSNVPFLFYRTDTITFDVFKDEIDDTNQELIGFISGIIRLLLGLQLDPTYNAPLPVAQSSFVPISSRSKRYLSEIVIRITPSLPGFCDILPLNSIRDFQAEHLDDPLYRLMEDYENKIGRELAGGPNVSALSNPNVIVQLQKCIQDELEDKEFSGIVRDLLLKRTQERTKVEIFPEGLRK